MGKIGIGPISMGVFELLVVLVVVLLIFGPKNLPKLGNAIGKTFKNLREGMEGKKKGGTSAEEANGESKAVVEDADDDADAETPVIDDAEESAKSEDEAEKAEAEESKAE